MKPNQFLVGACAAIAVSAAIVAGCGGGGGSSTIPPGPQPSPSISPSPGPSPTPILATSGMLAATGGTYPAYVYATAASDTVVFGCGCSSQAGMATTDPSGSFSAQSPVTPTPAVPNPMYTMVPGRNYVVIAEHPATLVGPQAWTILFAGKSPSTTLGLGDTGSVTGPTASSDVYTTAAALYIYKFSTQGGGGNAFDDWNFNAIQAWVQVLVTGPNTAERKLLDDIAAAGGANGTLFPGPTKPLWNPTQPTSGKISTDLDGVKTSTDLAKPTPCPGGPSACMNTPTP